MEVSKHTWRKNHFAKTFHSNATYYKLENLSLQSHLIRLKLKIKSERKSMFSKKLSTKCISLNNSPVYLLTYLTFNSFPKNIPDRKFWKESETTVKQFRLNSIWIFDFYSLTCQSLSIAEEICELFGDRKKFFLKKLEYQKPVVIHGLSVPYGRAVLRLVNRHILSYFI